jgi:hypothetical protein
MILIRKETNIGLEQLRLNVLAERLEGATGLFAVGTMRFDEWFDPAVQVYLATIFQKKLKEATFRYERVLLLGRRSAAKDLGSDYLDGYYAKCLVHIHRRLGIDLYYLERSEILGILKALTAKEKAQLGFYPSWMEHLSDRLARLLMWPIQGRRVRKVAVGVIAKEKAAGDGTVTVREDRSAFRFSKHDKIVQVKFEPEDRAAVYLKFADLVKGRVYAGSTKVSAQHDFLSYFP